MPTLPTETQLAKAHLESILAYERLPQTSPNRAALHQLFGAVANCCEKGYARSDVNEFVRLIFGAWEIKKSQMHLNGGEP